MNVQRDELQNIWVEVPLYWGDNIFTELFTQKLLDKEGLKLAHLRNKSGFLKYNYSLSGNTFQ